MTAPDHRHAFKRRREDPPRLRSVAPEPGEAVVVPEAGRDASRAVLPLQPEPIQALRVVLEAADGTTYTAVVRRWTAAAAARCRLCQVCTARVGADRQALCVVAVAGEVPADSAAVLSPDGLA